MNIQNKINLSPVSECENEYVDSPKAHKSLDGDEKRIYEFLKKAGKSHLDFIASDCNMTTSKVAYLLLNLELKGVLRPIPGNVFELL